MATKSGQELNQAVRGVRIGLRQTDQLCAETLPPQRGESLVVVRVSKEGVEPLGEATRVGVPQLGDDGGRHHVDDVSREPGVGVEDRVHDVRGEGPVVLQASCFESRGELLSSSIEVLEELTSYLDEHALHLHVFTTKAVVRLNRAVLGLGEHAGTGLDSLAENTNVGRTVTTVLLEHALVHPEGLPVHHVFHLGIDELSGVSRTLGVLRDDGVERTVETGLCRCTVGNEHLNVQVTVDVEQSLLGVQAVPARDHRQCLSGLRVGVLLCLRPSSRLQCDLQEGTGVSVRSVVRNVHQSPRHLGGLEVAVELTEHTVDSGECSVKNRVAVESLLQLAVDLATADVAVVHVELVLGVIHEDALENRGSQRVVLGEASRTHVVCLANLLVDVAHLGTGSRDRGVALTLVGSDSRRPRLHLLRDVTGGVGLLLHLVHQAGVHTASEGVHTGSELRQQAVNLLGEVRRRVTAQLLDLSHAAVVGQLLPEALVQVVRGHTAEELVDQVIAEPLSRDRELGGLLSPGQPRVADDLDLQVDDGVVQRCRTTVQRPTLVLVAAGDDVRHTDQGLSVPRRLSNVDATTRSLVGDGTGAPVEPRLTVQHELRLSDEVTVEVGGLHLERVRRVHVHHDRLPGQGEQHLLLTELKQAEEHRAWVVLRVPTLQDTDSLSSVGTEGAVPRILEHLVDALGERANEGGSGLVVLSVVTEDANVVLQGEPVLLDGLDDRLESLRHRTPGSRVVGLAALGLLDDRQPRPVVLDQLLGTSQEMVGRSIRVRVERDLRSVGDLRADVLPGRILQQRHRAKESTLQSGRGACSLGDRQVLCQHLHRCGGEWVALVTGEAVLDLLVLLTGSQLAPVFLGERAVDLKSVREPLVDQEGLIRLRPRHGSERSRHQPTAD